MQIRKLAITVVLGSILALPTLVKAQNSSINTFSPYTLFGIGDMATPGTAYIRSMGGAGVAYRNPMMINYLNPASASAVQRQSFLFNVGLEGANYYLKSNTAKSSFNTFNVRDVAVQFPIAKRLGFIFSMTPLSEVGYRMERSETDEDIIANLGDVKYKYLGEGNVTQFRAGIGMEIVKNVSLGVEAVYLHGNIDRTSSQVITPITTSQTFSSMNIYNNDNISRMFVNFGLQYNAISSAKHLLTVGATYQLGGNLNADRVRTIQGSYGDTISSKSTAKDIIMPSVLNVGLSYTNYKFNVNADYTFQNWGTQNTKGVASNPTDYVVGYTNTNSVKVGAQYTPNRQDIRRFYNRLTYRAGVRYNDYYLTFNGKKINEKAVSVGIGIPVKFMGTSNINIGAEYGQRGNTRNGLIKENFFKFSVGFSLFGEDYWFVKQKYD